MTVIKTSELTDQALDWAVGKCVGRDSRPGRWRGKLSSNCGIWTPSTDWSQGGPIIEQHPIQVGLNVAQLLSGEKFAAYSQSGVNQLSVGPTMLIAAMRCYVASKLGDEVDVPEGVLP